MRFRVFLLALTCSVSPALAGTEVFDYGDFGPQVASYELIGYEWFQWESHGDDDPVTHPEIKVVVYWGETLEEVKAEYPVDREKERDFRYLEYDKAVAHLKEVIAEFEQAKLDTTRLRAALERLGLSRSR